MKRFQALLLVALSLVIVGCGSHTASNPTANSVASPAITTQPASLSVSAGQTASFSVVASGTAPLSFQWSKNGTAISGATSSSFTTPATTMADNGSTFTVTVSNTAGSVTSSSATLTVTAVAPAITTQPANQSVVAGQTASFSVAASGTAPLSFQWSKNGVAISGATSSSFTTPATTVGDNGSSFTVKVSNAGGNATSNAATLTVTVAPVAPSITTQPGAQSVTVGQTAAFSVVANGTAPLSYQWSKNGAAINGATASSFTTPATTLADNGSFFTVTVSNSVGNATSNAAVLNVQAPATHVTGAAATGLAIPNATVTLKDSLGATATGTTDSNGNFDVVTTGMTSPFFLKIQPVSGPPIYSVSADANASTIINIHPLSDLVIRSWYSAQGISIDAAFANPVSSPPPAPPEVAVLTNVVTQSVQLWLTNAGITDPNFNLISTPFSAGTNAGLDHVLDETTVDLTTNPAAPTVTITDGTTTQTSTVSYNVAASSVSVSTTTTAPSGSSSSTTSTQVPTQTAQQAALSAIQATMNSFAGTVNSKGSALAASDVISFFDPALLHGGLNQAQFAAEAVSQFRGANIALTVNRINSLDTNTGIADVVFTLTQTQGSLSQNEINDFQFKNEGGTWMLFGDQRIAQIDLQAEMRTNLGAFSSNNGADINVDVQAPQAVNGTPVLSGVTISPLSVAGQTIFGPNQQIAAGVFIQGPVQVDTYNPTPTTSLVVDNDHYFLTSNLLSTTNLLPAGTFFTVTVAPVTGSPVSYTLPTTAFTTESTTITGMSTAAGPIPSAEATDPNLGNFPFNTPITVNWTLPATFPIERIKLNAQLFTGDQSNTSTFSCSIENQSVVPITATSGVITIPNTCNNLPVLQVNINVDVTGVNGERTTVIYFFDGLPSSGGSLAVSVSPPTATVTAASNSNTPFSANVTGSSNQAVTWGLSGANCSGATCGSITAGGVYTPPATAPSPNNQVVVTATAQADFVTQGTAIVTINAPAPAAPGIAVQPANQSVTAGQTATFSVTASGIGPFTYQWSENGTPIVGATSSSYTTPATTLADNNSTFTVTVTNGGGNVASNAATLTVTAAPTAPSITVPPANQSVTAGQTATFSVTAGGTAPLSYQWNENGTPIVGATSSSYTTPATTLADNNSSFTVTVTNGVGNITSSAAILAVNAGFNVSGNVSLINAGQGLAGISVSLSTNPVQTTTTDSSGNFIFANVPNATYTVTPSITGPASVFYPASQNITVNGSDATLSFAAALGYTVSGTVSYAGAASGQVYLSLQGTNGGSTQGASITWPTATSFTIRGVAPGTYTLQAWMDTQGHGAQNAANPTGSSPNVIVTAANLTGASVTLNDPAAPTLGASPNLKGVSAFDQGAVVQFKGITDNNGLELPTAYTLQWSTDPTFSTVSGSQNFVAVGANGGPSLWIVNGLTNATSYYFRAEGVAGSATSPWSSAFGPVTIGAPVAANVVSGAVTFTGTANGPLYVGFFDMNTGNVFATKISSPVSPQAYSVQVPTGSNYFFFGIVDQNNDGIVDVGDISNTSGNGAAVAIAGSTSTEDVTLPSGNASAAITTQHFTNPGQLGSADSYSLNFDIRALGKLPVAVAVVSGPNVLAPMDVAQCTFCGGGGRFNFSASLNASRPNVGDTYGLQVTYSDGTSETLTVTVGAVLDAFVTNPSPSGSVPGATQPTFTWTDPANASSYTYQFTLSDTNGNTIWQVPGNNSNSNGFSSSITSITWGTDPTGGNSLPSVVSLTSGVSYQWQIQVQDSNGNSAAMLASFKP